MHAILLLVLIHMYYCTYICIGMEFESGPGNDSYDYQFVKWLAKEKVNAVCVCGVLCSCKLHAGGERTLWMCT